LTRDPSHRLGSGAGDVEEVKVHPFFSDHLNWDLLAAGKLSPPWEPTVLGSLDTSQFDNEFTSMPLHSPPTNTVQSNSFFLFFFLFFLQLCACIVFQFFFIYLFLWQLYFDLINSTTHAYNFFYYVKFCDMAV
jgi:hypothetical protein